MTSRPNLNLNRVLKMTRDMSALADVGEAESEDAGCAVLFGIVRDCAYRIRGRAEQERDAHRSMGLWAPSGA